MKRWIVATWTLVLASGGCGRLVFEPVGSGPESEPPEEAAPSARNAVAMRYGDWQALPLPGDGLGYPHPPGFVEPSPADSLVLFFSDRPQPCTQPMRTIEDGNDADPLPFWQLMLVIPPELHRPGLIDLRDSRINVSAQQDLHSCVEPTWLTECGSTDAGGCCGGSGGVTGPGAWGDDAWDSTLTILDSDGAAVDLVWAGPLADWGADFGGHYTVTQCGAPAPTYPPAAALAIRGEDLPVEVGEPPPDPGSLYLVLGTAPHTCEDPSSAMDCTDTFRVTLRLPPALQQPGIIDLTDPVLGASFSRSWGEPGSCGPDDFHTAPFENGTIEILSIDETAVSCRLYGSTSRDGERIDADGLYAVSVCP